MPRSQQRRRKGHGELRPPLSVLERVRLLLEEQLITFPSKRELTDAEIEHWHRDLNPYRLDTIEWAFDNWRRNGHFFPVYADIVEMCETWQPDDPIHPHGCSPECKARHGKGYGKNDMLWLWKRHATEREKLGRALTKNEWSGLYAELDNSRGGPPEYRTG
jgi:hypothetical protein